MNQWKGAVTQDSAGQEPAERSGSPQPCEGNSQTSSNALLLVTVSCYRPDVTVSDLTHLFLAFLYFNSMKNLGTFPCQNKTVCLNPCWAQSPIAMSQHIASADIMEEKAQPQKATSVHPECSAHLLPTAQLFSRGNPILTKRFWFPSQKAIGRLLGQPAHNRAIP